MTESVSSTSQRNYEIWGNWKMNPRTIDEAEQLAEDISKEHIGLMRDVGNEVLRRINVGLFVPDIFMSSVGRILGETHDNIELGAQNMYFESEGAFTGETSAAMIRSILTYADQTPTVLIGHSERRHVFGETDEMVNRKMHAVYEHGIRPFLAIGETEGQRAQGRTELVLYRQIRKALKGVPAETFSGAMTVLAYEPVWAIGTGKTATPEMAQHAHAYAREVLAEMYGRDVADATTIQYGGSMKPENAAELLAQPDIDGGLIGGASLQAAPFIGIVSGIPILG